MQLVWVSSGIRIRLNHFFATLREYAIIGALPTKPMNNVKWILLLLGLNLYTQANVFGRDQIASDVYSWNAAPVEKIAEGTRRTIVKGSATDFSLMEISAFTLDKGKTVSELALTNYEVMIVFKDGSLKISINGEGKTVGRGSVAIILPGDTCSFSNTGDGDATFYTLRYQSKAPMDAERGKKSGGSFIMDWNDAKFTPRDDGKGGTRQFFTRPTAMGKRLDLHSTLLDPSQSSHEPHHHRAEEMIIVLDADVEMYLGPAEKDGRTKKATSGDIIYLVSNEYHAISNIGTKPALYFAFQFE
jgi:(S)-ureidoglycine aminohydrolase